jgi:hypothetical protein
MKRTVRVGVPHYTYRGEKAEEKTVYRRLAIIGGITVILLLVVWFWGITFVRILGALGTNESENTSQFSFEIPLQEPSITSLPEFTNKEKITISGKTTAEVNVTLFVNGVQVSNTIADVSGGFSFVNVSLKNGLNFVKVAASDASGATQDTTEFITLDKTKPTLEISTPSDGQVFPKKTKKVSVKGRADPDSDVFINSIQAITDQNGNFTYSLTVSKGENKIEIKATDKAGNTKTQKLTIILSG